MSEHVCEPPVIDRLALAHSRRHWDCPADGIRWVLVKRMIGRQMYAEWRRLPAQPDLDSAPIDWPARIRAAADEAQEMQSFTVERLFRELAAELDRRPAVVEAIGRCLLGETS
jgi:hypothetical protein